MNLIQEGTVTTPAGFAAGTAASGVKYVGQLDLALIFSSYDCITSAVFTRNQVVAAPVIVDRETVKNGNQHVRAIVANSGNANACTGAPGLDNAYQMQHLAANALGCQADQVLILSTGVIGVQLPMARIASGINEAARKLARANGKQAAQAIMTTDTHPKHMAVQVTLGGGDVTIGGMAKGAGMIHPYMATLLGVFTTDAVVAPNLLDRMLQTAVNQSFNRISVDGDTSTNDTVLLLANGASEVRIVAEEDISQFQEALNTVCVSLAKMIVRDGEGASKFVEINVSGAPDDTAAHAIASTIATSPLVKTAFAGSDANWGRILAAAGRAGVCFDQSQVTLWIGLESATELQLVADGTPVEYLESEAAAIFAEPAFKIMLNLGAGPGTTTLWTSDLSHEYVTINADYRT
ncbi:MAG: bifunctional glutamate N-acetyltransferase/amino-acid acetyltransferase ArgJ [Anaerolineaceae bacterium]|nr:MAG: bifunctional glutamate N-acetyltransferase/amino-acid acetyltransferase ArgJ [Anaerolineaceae bacterium]